MIKRESLEAILSEVSIYRLGAALGFPMAKYWRYDRDAVQSEDFTENGKYSLQTARALIGEDYESDFPYNCKTFERLSPEMLKQYLAILFMGALCMNYDRHIGNYGILTDPENGAIVSMAPNFDNNLALLTNDLPKWGPVMGFLTIGIYFRSIPCRRFPWISCIPLLTPHIQPLPPSLPRRSCALCVPNPKSGSLFFKAIAWFLTGHRTVFSA